MGRAPLRRQGCGMVSAAIVDIPDTPHLLTCWEKRGGRVLSCVRGAGACSVLGSCGIWAVIRAGSLLLQATQWVRTVSAAAPRSLDRKRCTTCRVRCCCHMLAPSTRNSLGVAAARTHPQMGPRCHAGVGLPSRSLCKQHLCKPWAANCRVQCRAPVSG